MSKKRRALARTAQVALAKHPAPENPAQPPQHKIISQPSLSRTFGRSLQQVSPTRITTTFRRLDLGYFDDFADLVDQAQRDPIFRRGSYVRRASVAARPYTVAPPDDVDPAMRNAADELAGMTREALANIEQLDARNMVVLEGIGNGVDVHELDWQRKHGLFLPTISEESHVATRDLWIDRDRRLLARDADLTWHVIDGSLCDACGFPHKDKFLIHRPAMQSGKPQFQGEYIAAMYHWLFKLKGWTFWLSGAERHGNPIAIIQAGKDATAEQCAELLGDLQQMTADSQGVLKGETTLTVHDPKAAASVAIWSELIDNADRQVLIAMGVPPDMIIASANGSRAALSTRDGLRTEGSIFDDAAMWGSWIRYVVKPIRKFNMRREDVPLPVIRGTFDNAQPIPTEILTTGRVRYNEARASVGLQALGDDEGGDEFIPAPAPAAPSYGGGFSSAPVTPATPPPASPGGAPAASPFPTSPLSAGGMPALSTTSPTSPTSSHSAVNPRRFARVPPSDVPTS